MSRINVVLKIVVVACFLLFLWIGCTTAKTLVVNQTSPACIMGDFRYDRIQKAVDMADDGDTIIVCPGIYIESIEVNKSVSIQSYEGAANTIVEAYNTSKNVFNVTADHVTISGFTIRYSGLFVSMGISLDEVAHCVILNNHVHIIESHSTASYKPSDYSPVIRLRRSNNNTIKDNVIMKAKGAGIVFFASRNNILEKNIICDSQGVGFLMKSSYNNLIQNNIITNNWFSST